MQIRLLGPVEVWNDGVPLDAGTTRQRWVLAALAVDAGRPVLVDTVVDRVWGEAPPLRARETVHVYIARIRKMFARAGTGAIVRRSNGYVLDLDPARVDLQRFRQLAAAARTPGDRQTRLALLRDAVDLWHGEPLADLAGDWPLALRQHLRQEHLETLDDWADAEIAAGNPNAPVRRLTALIDQYPLAESLLAALLRALQAAGRTAEALDRYERARKRLAEELGTDPSPELQDVYRSILAGAPRPTELTRVQEKMPFVPAQLPLDVPGFTGRQSVLSTLDALVAAPADTVVIAALSGTAGVGKTAVSVHWAHQVRHSFPDGQLFVNLRGYGPSSAATDPAEALEGFLAALGVPADRIPADLEARAATYRSLLADRRVLIVIDNAGDADQARPLLPSTPGCVAIVTSRNQLTSLVAIEGARPVPLDLLSSDEAHAMLAARLGADRVTIEADAVDRLSTACARLPIALAIVAAHAAGQPDLPLRALADELGRSADGARLDVLDGGDPSSNVRTVFSWSVRGLDPPAARLLRLLGIHPGPAVSVAAAASIAGIGTREAADLLAELTRASLVTEQSPGRYVMHDLLHAYATDLVRQTDDEQDRRAAEHRMLDYYLLTSAHAARLLHPHMTPIAVAGPEPGAVVVPMRDAAGALAWFTAEDPVLLGLVHHASRLFDRHVWQLARSRELFAIRQGRLTGMIAIQRLALAATRRAGERAAEAQARLGLARAHLWHGDLDEAQRNLMLALEIFADLDDPTGMARAEHAVTELFDRKGDHRTALEHAYRALHLYESAGDRPGTARALNAVGWCHTRLDEHDTAVERCERALALLRAIGDVDGEAATCGSLGHAYQRLGRFDDAIDHYHRAIDLCRGLGELFYEADTLTHLGDTHLSAGDAAAARTAWQRALDILTDLEHPNAEDVRSRLAS